MVSQLKIPGKAKPYLMAHRGNQVLYPENTLIAFKQAFQDGADILETDLQISKDGAFVCIHDETVDRTTNGRGLVAEMTLNELKELDASHGHSETQEEKIPTLPETAAILPKDVVLALELKSDAFRQRKIVQRLVDELTHLGIRARTVIVSFSYEHLQVVKSIASDLPVGWITLKNPLPANGVHMAGPYWPLLLLNPFYMWQARWKKQVVAPLDPDPDKRLRFYQLLGCDAVMSNNPAKTYRALELLRRR